jgi:lactate permease
MNLPHWIQVYFPFGEHNWWLSALVASLPIIVLFSLMAGFRVKPHWSALCAAITAVVVANLAFTMPWSLAGASFLFGVGTGLMNIIWIVVAAVYLYDISVSTGDFEIMKSSVGGITADRRLQLLLVAFCFGAFIEGCAGFGSPVAIAGAFMIGLGFKPFHAAALNLIANTAPVAWGAIGTPVHMLTTVTGLPEADMNAMIGRILPITAVIVPFWLVRAMVPWKETFEVLPAILVVGVSFASMQFFWSNRMDANLVDITAGLFSLLCAVVFLLFWKPKRVWRFEGDEVVVAKGATLGVPSVSGASPAADARPSGQGTLEAVVLALATVGPLVAMAIKFLPTISMPTTFSFWVFVVSALVLAVSVWKVVRWGHRRYITILEIVAVPAVWIALVMIFRGGNVNVLYVAIAVAVFALLMVGFSAGEVTRAWMPFAVLSVFVLCWGLAPIKTWMNVHTTPGWNDVTMKDGKPVLDKAGKPVTNKGFITPLHNLISRDKPVVTPDPKTGKLPAEGAVFPFIWLSATGTGCFLAAIVGGLIRGVNPIKLIQIFGHTLFRMRWAVLAISCMLGLGFVTRYSGTDAVLGLAFTHTGWFYPFFGTFLGWLGVALTGSDTSSNALFGSLQKITAQQLGLDPVLMTAANSAGGVMGKMVDAQSITVATAATNQIGNEGIIFRFVVWHSIALGTIVGLIVMFYAYVVPNLVPHGVKLLSQ